MVQCPWHGSRFDIRLEDLKIGRIQNRFDYHAMVFVPISVLKAGVFRTEFLQIHLGILYSCP
jgi:hypothetical protein